jgi:hypothetical protein
LRVVCRKTTLAENGISVPDELHYKYHEEVTLKVNPEDVVKRENLFRSTS